MGAAIGLGVGGGRSPAVRTPPRHRREGRRSERGGGGLVVPKPTGPGGPPASAARQLGDLGDHRGEQADRGRAPAGGGPLRIYNYADYIDPATVKKFQQKFNTKVQVATYNSSDEAIAKLAVRRGRVRRDHRADRLEHRRPDRPASCSRRSTTPTCRTSRRTSGPSWPDPFYDRGSRYTVPYVVWMDGIGWRNDKVKEDIGMDVPWDIFWRRRPTAARSASSTTGATR